VRFTAIILFLSVALFAFSQRFAPPVIDPDTEQEIFRRVNLERSRAGLSSVRLDTGLQKAARQHSRIMADARQLSHEFGGEPPFYRRLALAGASFDLSGENVAFSQSGERVHRSLMASPPHRANILNRDFTSIGIGVVRTGNDIWVTQDFTRAFEIPSEQEARNQVIAAFEYARRQAKLPPVAVVDEPRLQAHACRMAEEGELDTQTPLGWSTFRSATAYTKSDLSNIPSTAMKLVTNPAVQRISVAVCFGKSAMYESGMNWVTIAAY
jgi:uncharacterized protein YkwD